MSGDGVGRESYPLEQLREHDPPELSEVTGHDHCNEWYKGQSARIVLLVQDEALKQPASEGRVDS